MGGLLGHASLMNPVESLSDINDRCTPLQSSWSRLSPSLSRDGGDGLAATGDANAVAFPIMTDQ
jgi:hypothetical protein